MIRLIIEEVDPDNNGVISSAPLDINSVADIENCIDIEFDSDVNLYYDYNLINEDLVKLATAFDLSGLGTNGVGRIRRRVEVDDLPYRVHTGSELLLMLSGGKPMSVFTYELGDKLGVREIVEQLFSSYVKDKVILKFQHKIKHWRNNAAPVEIEYLIYTLPKEKWRAKAMVTLKQAGALSGWSEGMERMEGMLLGYSDLQNDIYIEKIFRKSGRGVS